MASVCFLRNSLFVFTAVVLGAMPNLTRVPAAAPDNTLGMALMSAAVDGANPPNIVRGSGAVSVSRQNVGIFEVVFDRDISTCICTASAGGAKGDFVGGFFATANCPYLSLNNVGVNIRSFSGNATDVAFQLIVFCPR